MNAKNTEWWKSPEFAPFFGGGDTQQQTAQPQFNAQAIGGKYGYTGKGPDGVAQPDRRVPGIGSGQNDMHEAEFVMDANTTQAIGPDVLAQVMRAAKNGKLDLNKLREAVGMQPKQGFQEGGPAPVIPTGGTPVLKKSTAQIVPNVIEPIKPNVIQPDNQIIANKIEPIKPDVVQPDNITIPDPNKINIQPDVIKPIPQQDIINPNKINIQPDVIQPINPNPPLVKKEMQAKIPLMVNKDEIQAKLPLVLDKNKALKMIKTLPVDVQEELQDIPQQDIIDYFMGVMKGDNPYFKMLQDLLSQKIGGAGAAATAAMKQEAAMSGWGKEQLGSLGIGRQRDIESQSSQAVGELATQQAGMGMEAANKLWGMNQDLQQQENWEKTFDYTKLTNDQKNEQWQKLFDQDNERWGKTWDEALKDKDFNKQTDMLNALLSSGGEANLKKASEMMKQMYGQDIDFDNMLDKEKQTDFNTAWNNMGGLIASNMDWEQALLTMKKDGTFDKLGMTEEDLKNVYDKQKLQNDPAYKMMQQVDGWIKQGIMTQEQGDQYKNLFQWSLTHPDGIEIADGYVVKDESGNEVGFFKSIKERDDFMAANKDKGYTSSDEIVNDHISKTSITGDGGGGGSPGITIPQGGVSGNIFIKNGKVYKINDKGIAEEEFNADIPDNIKVGDTFLVGEGETAQLFVLGGNGLSKQIDDTVLSNIWSTDANSAINHGEDSPYYKKLLDLRIDDIISKKYDFSKIDAITNKYLRTSEKVSHHTIDSLGSDNYITDKRYAIKTLENLTKGAITTIDNVPLQYVSSGRKGRAGTDGTYYDFVDNKGKKYRLYFNGHDLEWQ